MDNQIESITRSTTTNMELHWGIAGAGKISNDFVVAVKSLKSPYHVVQAIAARRLESATEFADHFGIPEVYEGYQSIANHKKINCVYIGVINTEHFALAKLMLEHGKNVLCEKPLCMNSMQTQELFEIAKKHKLFLMEAMWSRCFPAYKELRRQLEADKIGKVLQLSVNFGFPLDHINRVMVRELGGGAMYDIGVYVLQLAQFVFPGESPVDIKVTGQRNEHGVDIFAGILMEFPGKKFAVMSINARAVMSNTAEVIGSKGFIQLPKFWCPTELITPEGTKLYPLPEPEFELKFYNSTGLGYEAEEVRRCIELGLLESPTITSEQSIELAKWRDEILRLIPME